MRCLRWGRGRQICSGSWCGGRGRRVRGWPTAWRPCRCKPARSSGCGAGCERATCKAQCGRPPSAASHSWGMAASTRSARTAATSSIPAGLTGRAEVSGLSLAPGGKQIAASVRLRCGSRIVVANLSSTGYRAECQRGLSPRRGTRRPVQRLPAVLVTCQRTDRVYPPGGAAHDLYEVEPSNVRPERYRLRGITHPRSPGLVARVVAASPAGVPKRPGPLPL